MKYAWVGEMPKYEWEGRVGNNIIKCIRRSKNFIFLM